MGVEIERKFLVDTSRLILPSQGDVMIQGYLSLTTDAVVRIRVSGEQAWLTVKGRTRSATRAEFEYAIPRDDANAMLALCQEPPISKTRYRIPVDTHEFEVDVFDGANAGLIIAEVELTHEHEAVMLPDWITKEVTGDVRYYNSSLATSPYSLWNVDDKH